MLRGDSRSYTLGSGGVDTWKMGFLSIPVVDDGTTLPEIDRPFIPNGTGGFRTPKNQKAGFRFRLKKLINEENLYIYQFHPFFQLVLRFQ